MLYRFADSCSQLSANLKNSWGWTDELSETCRVSSQK